jgi:hypothetical protein
LKLSNRIKGLNILEKTINRSIVWYANSSKITAAIITKPHQEYANTFLGKRRSFIKQNCKKQTIERDSSFKAALLLKRFQFVFAKFE